MNAWTSALRLGAPSALYPEDVLPNVRRLAGLVQNIEWEVFEVTCDTPGPEALAEMARLGAAYGHSYTVHLPLDLFLADEDEGVRRDSVELGCRVIARGQLLNPWAYVVHIKGEGASADWGPWHERAAASLVALGEAAGGCERLAVENIPRYPAAHLWPLAARLPVSLCIDAGHLLRQGADPRPLLGEWLDRVRVIHLHGYDGHRDHRSLAAMDQGMLLDILRILYRRRYPGVITIECFQPQAFFDSWDLVESLWRRVQRERETD